MRGSTRGAFGRAESGTSGDRSLCRARGLHVAASIRSVPRPKTLSNQLGFPGIRELSSPDEYVMVAAAIVGAVVLAFGAAGGAGPISTALKSGIDAIVVKLTG